MKTKYTFPFFVFFLFLLVSKIYSAPVANDDSVTLEVTKASSTLSFDPITNDTGNRLRINGIVAQPDKGTATINSRKTRIIYTPDINQVPYITNLSYNVRDNRGNGELSNTATITITVNGPASPTASNDLAQMTVPTETNTNISVLGNDLGSSLKINDYTQPSNGSVNSRSQNTVLRYTPNSSFIGTDTFTYRVIDKLGRISDYATVNVTVNGPPEPVAVDDSAGITVPEANSVTISALANDTGYNLTVNAIPVHPTNGTISLVNGDTQILYTPHNGFLGTDTFTYTVIDFYGRTSGSATVTVTVSQDPIAVNDSATLTRPNEIKVEIRVLDNDAPAGDIKVNEITSQPSNGTAKIVRNNNRIEYTPNSNFFSGTDTFMYTVYLKRSNPLKVSNPATVTVTVIAPEPPIAVDDTGALFLPDNSVNIAVLPNDTVTGTNNFLEIVSQPSHGSISIRNNNDIRYTRNSSFTSGTDSFSYKIRDEIGQESNTATVTVSVVDVPIANDDTAKMDNNQTSIRINVLANDVPTDATINTYSQPNYGITSINRGRIRYTPTVGYTGPDSFTYDIEKNGKTSNTATVSIYVGTLPQVVATDDSAVVETNKTVSIPVLENDSGALLSIKSITSPSNGTAIINSSNIDYTSNTNYVGNDSFTYTIKDEFGSEATANVSVVVTEEVKAVDDTANTESGIPVSIPVLSNDTGSSISIKSVSSPSNGSASISGENIVYISSANFTGTATFTYTIQDKWGIEATGNVSVNVGGEIELSDEEQQVNEVINSAKTDINGIPAAVQLKMYSKIFEYYSTHENIRASNQTDLSNIADDFNTLANLKIQIEEGNSSAQNQFDTNKSNLLSTLNDFSWNSQ